VYGSRKPKASPADGGRKTGNLPPVLTRWQVYFKGVFNSLKIGCKEPWGKPLIFGLLPIVPLFCCFFNNGI
jgi:hypothetical protein